MEDHQPTGDPETQTDENHEHQELDPVTSGIGDLTTQTEGNSENHELMDQTVDPIQRVNVSVTRK